MVLKSHKQIHDELDQAVLEAYGWSDLSVETMSDLHATPMPGSEFLFCQSDDGGIRLQVRLKAESVWPTQKPMAELFEKDVRTINEHIQNIFEEGELTPETFRGYFRSHRHPLKSEIPCRIKEVERSGFEPLTPCMPCKCSTN